MKNDVNINNRKVGYDYTFIRDLTAGIVLLGTEVKQIHAGKVSLTDSFCIFHNGELFIKQMNITAVDNAYSHEPLRDKKLLLKRNELNKLQKDLLDGMTIVVKKLFTTEKGHIKALISLAKGKKNYDKRESLKNKDIDKQLKNKQYEY